MTDETPAPAAESFVREVLRELGLPGDVQGLGPSRTLRVEIEGRPVRVGANGSCVWVEVDLPQAAFPADATLFFAPAASYYRGKLLADGGTLHPTGDPAFDGTYLVLGEGGARAAARLTPGARAVLLEGARHQLEIHGVHSPADRQGPLARPVLRATPDLRAPGPERSDPAPGEENFTPAFAARAAREVAALAHRLVGCLAEATEGPAGRP